MANLSPERKAAIREWLESTPDDDAPDEHATLVAEELLAALDESEAETRSLHIAIASATEAAQRQRLRGLGTVNENVQGLVDATVACAEQRRTESVREVLDLVNTMRAAQRRYFQTRDSGDLRESKRLEGLVDKRIEGFYSGQAGLFPTKSTEAPRG